jgi:hypothetical protein
VSILARRFNPDKIEDALEVLAKDVHPPEPYWFDNTDVEGEFDYACAKLMLAEVRAKYPEAEIDGGWSSECDGDIACQKCGKLLAYTLTDWGAEDQIKYFRDERDNDPLIPENGYQLLRIWYGQMPDDLKKHREFWLTMFDRIQKPVAV